MPDTAVTPSPGFISIAVSDAQRSAAFYEKYLGAVWWRASDAQALYESVIADGVPILQEPYVGPFGRTFAMADPDGYRVTIYEKDRPQFWPPPRS